MMQRDSLQRTPPSARAVCQLNGFDGKATLVYSAVVAMRAMAINALLGSTEGLFSKLMRVLSRTKETQYGECEFILFLFLI